MLFWTDIYLCGCVRVCACVLYILQIYLAHRTFTLESRPQHHAKRALKPLGTIALLSSITCRESETSVSGSFKLTLPPPFSVIPWSSTTEEEGQRKRQIYCILGRSSKAKKVHGGSKHIKQNYKIHTWDKIFNFIKLSTMIRVHGHNI